MTEQIIIAGFGGQGVLTMGQLIAYAGMTEGKNVSWLPSYGPEMRGGTANCNVIVSSQPVGSPVVTDADAVIVMNRPSLEKYESYIVPGGKLFINSSLIKCEVSRADVNIYRIPANDIAAKAGNPRVANIAMLGAYLTVSGAVSRKSVDNAVKNLLGELKAHLIPVNQTAMDEGAKCVRGQQS
ncbi:MAG: 2-oxoacid:acceptor oxidoreductase family protein [Christensenellales bacterium]